ncbi:Cullin family protein [Xylariales sp. PMI_506]|nr:Cullin family protein [Xylariales sp. PMI_506]
MATETRWNAGKRRAFQSVFKTHISQPTPYSTPSVRFSEQGQPFGGPLAPATPTWADPHSELPNQLASPVSRHASEQTRFDRSWHIVTSRIALPASVTVEDSFGPLPNSQDTSQDGVFEDALREVLNPRLHLPYATQIEDILTWHTQQVRLHFVNHVLPLLAVCDSYTDQTQVLLGTIRTLEAAHRQYLFGLSLIIRAMDQSEADQALKKFRRDLHATVGNSMSSALLEALRNVLGQLMSVILCMPNTAEGPQHDVDQARVQAARTEMFQLVESLCKIGLAGERFQILFAELLNHMMVTYIQDSFAGRWRVTNEPGSKMALSSQQATVQPLCIRQLSEWVENHCARLAVEVTNHLGNVQVAWTDMEKWKEIAVGRLATLRIHELFDIVIDWPKSEGGINDLRYTVTTPQRRLQLTDAFSAALEKRLLHPGRSTLDILRTYIAMIKSFQKLDHSRVLLDRVAYSLQLYLCTRDDTVRIIVTSLLSNPEEATADAHKTKLVELVELLRDPDQNRTERQDDEWDDLSWIPAPVDAGINYKRHKSDDVIGTLIGAVGSAEVFIKEFQSIIGERLLSKKESFEQEVGVLSLLKKRYGEPPLQSCDVMIKDIQDSKRLDGVIHRGAINHSDKTKLEWNIHTKILSRLFWPDMGDEQFVIPAGVSDMQKTYENIFEHLKPSRKLKWLNHLGRATVELELEDRTILKEVHTYEAAVISAFSDAQLSGRAASWSFEDLWMHLQMDEDLLTAALQFWEGQMVLQKLPTGEYVVVESLEDAEQHLRTSAASMPRVDQTAAPAPAAASPRKPKSGLSEKEKEKRRVYWQFTVGMLTNSSPAMPLGQIAMMLKMMIPDGFPWSNEELQEFLGDKISDGELELVGGKYKLVKK